MTYGPAVSGGVLDLPLLAQRWDGLAAGLGGVQAVGEQVAVRVVGVGLKKTDRPVPSLWARGSLKPRTPDTVP
jgi:hypothetical protein